MKRIKNLYRYVIYLFFFSLNFEAMDLFNLGIDYLATKITIVLLMSIAILELKSILTLKQLYKYIIPLIIYFTFLTLRSFVNRSSFYDIFFDFPFFLNILIFIILFNFSKKEQFVLLKGLLAFSFGVFLNTLFYFLGFNVVQILEGRFVVFGGNANEFGLSIAISILILISIIFENKLAMNRLRYFMLILFPFFISLILLTGSRIAFLSLVLGAFIFLIYKKSIHFIIKLIYVFIVISTFALFWSYYLRNTFLGERLTNSIERGDLSQRDNIWDNLYSIISENIFLGVGKTGYESRIYPIFGNHVSPHNVIIEVLCYTGLVGLIIFLIFISRIIKSAYSEIKIEILPFVLLVPIFGMILSAQIFAPKIVWVIFAYIISQKSFLSSPNLKAQ